MNEKILMRVIIVAAFLIANCSVAEDGPVAHWTFDGTLNDQVGANHGVYTSGGDISYVEGFDGKERGAIRFNGVDFVKVPRVIMDEMTIACWVRLDMPQVITGSGGNFYEGPGLAQGERNEVTEDAGLAIVGEVAIWGSGRPDMSAKGTKSLITGKWIHIAATRNINNAQGVAELRLYVDGLLEAQVDHSYTGPLAAHDTFAVGGHEEPNRRLKGDIDDLRFYDRALSEDQIRALASPDPVAEEVGDKQDDANSPDVADGPDDTNAVVGQSDANEFEGQPFQAADSGGDSVVEDRLYSINSIALYVLLALVAGILIYAGIKLLVPGSRSNGLGLRWVASLESGEGAEDRFRLRLGVMPNRRGSVAKMGGTGAEEVFVTFNGEELRNCEEVGAAIDQAWAGDMLSLTFLRKGAASVDKPETPAFEREMNTEEEDVVLGVICEDDENNRISVVDVVEGSPADKAGIRPGDVILEIGDSKVESVEALVDCMEGFKQRKKLEIVLIRAGGDDTAEKLAIDLKG